MHTLHTHAWNQSFNHSFGYLIIAWWRLIDWWWLIEWLIDWLVMIVWLIDWLIDWLVKIIPAATLKDVIHFRRASNSSVWLSALSIFSNFALKFQHWTEDSIQSVKTSAHKHRDCYLKCKEHWPTCLWWCQGKSGMVEHCSDCASGTCVENFLINFTHFAVCLFESTWAKENIKQNKTYIHNPM